VKLVNGEVDAMSDATKESEDRYNQQKELFKTRLKVMYENSKKSYIETLLESKSISDFFQRAELISRVSKRDKQIIQELGIEKKDLEFKKGLKEAEMKSKQKDALESQQLLDNLKTSRASLDTQIKKISSTIDELNRQEDDLYKKSEELSGQIKGLQKSGSKYTGSMTWPTPGHGGVSSYYGMRLHPILKVYKMHTGIDINAPAGASIIAANKGTVILAGWQSGYGYTIIIDHGGGISTLYAHCSRILVGVGDNVNEGSLIGKVGSTGLATGPHLHFEVRRNGATTNPLDYVSP
jgi:murein DD-endopeptidase MepM/ murein hydrolase activator NlpD